MITIFDNFGQSAFIRSPPPQVWSWLGHRWSSSCPFLSSPCEPANDSSPSTDPLLQPPAQIRSQKLKQKNYQKCSTYQTFPTLGWMFDYYESVFHFHPVGEYKLLLLLLGCNLKQTCWLCWLAQQHHNTTALRKLSGWCNCNVSIHSPHFKSWVGQWVMWDDSCHDQWLHVCRAVSPTLYNLIRTKLLFPRLSLLNLTLLYSSVAYN